MNMLEYWRDHFRDILPEIEKSHHGVVQDDLDNSGDMSLLSLNPWHHESVMEHIEMVRQEALNKSNDPLLEMLALLHDVGKPMLRQFDKEKLRCRFSGHEYASALLSVNILKEYCGSYDLTLDMLKVITFHIIGLQGGNPYDYDVNENVIKYLKLLNEVDNKGRIADNPEEYDPVWFPNLKDEVSIKDKKFTLLIGCPRSGKSTYANKLSDDIPVISPDMFVEQCATDNNTTYTEAFDILKKEKRDWTQEAKNLAIDTLSYSDHVVYDATNMVKKKRVGLCKRAREKGASIHYVMFWRDLKDCMKCGEDKEKTIPEGVYKSMIRSFTYPKTEEYDTMEHIIT